MRQSLRRRRLGPGFGIALAWAGVAIVALRATSTSPQPPEDFYYFDSKPVALTRSQTEVVVRFAGGVYTLNRLTERTPGLQNALQTVAEGRRFHVMSLPAQVVIKGQPQQSNATPAAERLNQLMQSLRQDPDVLFVAPVFHYPATGIRILPTDEVTVRLKPGDSGQDLASLVSGFGLTVDRTLDGITDVFVLRMTDGKGPNALEVSRALYETGRFAWAEPNLVQAYKKSDVPNDPLFANQWHLNNTGQGGGTVDADSDLVEAWDIEDGNGTIVIAVVDDGMEKTHEDLAAAVFVNPGEIAANGIDDDANGKIDDVSGWDFLDNDNDVNPTTAADNHGTAVAGVAAARGNNAIGVTGACRNCKILPVKIFEDLSFSATSTAIANALTYAASFADVINNSWGGGAPSAAIQTAIGNANTTGRGGKGALVMFASGNFASFLNFLSFPGFSAGTYGFQLIYSKNASGSGGSDTAWVPWMQLPGGEYVDFSAGIPAGWTTGGNAVWTSVTDPVHSDEGICLTKTGKAGTIGNNQTSYVQILNKAVGAGTWNVYFWVSTALFSGDGLSFKVDLDNNGTFESSLAGIVSSNAVEVVPVAYPAAHPESIAVGASSNMDCRSHYSQFGPELAFVAPGSAGARNLEIITTDRTGTAGYNTAAAPAGNYTVAAYSGFSTDFHGTSSATPLASGIAALVLSRSPSLSRTVVLDILKGSADKVGPEPYVAGRNDRYGFGRLNAYEALLDTPVVPGAPTDVVATAFNANASVSFSAPASNGGAAITSYTVTSSPGGLTSSGPSSPLVVMGLTNGVSYTFTVTATNFVGTGPASSASNSVTPVPPPGALTKISPANTATGQPVKTLLSWGAASGATSYDYCIDTINNNTCDTFFQSTGTATSVQLSPLPASTAHYWQVRASNGSGTTYAEGSITAFWSFTTGAASGPFGQVDTPAQNAAGVQGAIGVTGWALDDIGVNKVEIFRNCLGGFDAPNCQMVLGQSVVYIGDAAFLTGARPDVAAAFPTYPDKNRAGWGYLMLTPMLPHVTNSQPYGGQGPLTIYAIASDGNGNKQVLGRTSNPGDSTPTAIGMTNDTIAKPFGAIDTPGQGHNVEGVYNNFGWAITPDTNSVAGDPDDIVIATNGSTMTVFIDAMPVSLVAYNQCRGNVGNPPPGGVYCNDDVANVFGNATPQPPLATRTSNPTKFRNLDAARGAIGAYTFNTASLSNGLHTIAWSVTDSNGRNEGIGSRFFIVDNGAWPSASSTSVQPSPGQTLGSSRKLERRSRVTSGVWGRTGFDLATRWTKMHAKDDGTFTVRLSESGRLELWLGEAVEAGYVVANGTLQGLPIGSALSGQRFAWMPPAGYIGPYHLAFVRGGERIDVTVTVVEKPRAEEGKAEIRMHLDAATQGPARVGHLSERPVRVEGWAFDPQAAIGSGIAAVHVWATPEHGGGAPFFLGAAGLDEPRPDVRHTVADAPGHTGFSMTASLKPGTYTLTAYAWNERTERWQDARSVTVVVR